MANEFAAIGIVEGASCDMVVLLSWPLMPLVGVSGAFVASTALLSTSISAHSLPSPVALPHVSKPLL